MAGLTLPEKVAQIYYTYGLFCSSYPFAAISFALTVVLLCCYPLLNVPLPGNIPTIVKLQLHDELGPDYQSVPHTNNKPEYDPIQLAYIRNETQKLPYIWAKEKPFLYVQQIILKTGVSPWNSNLKIWDAFRVPLQEVFRLLETIRNHEDPETKSTLANHCYQVDNAGRGSERGAEPVMPEYSCLLLSPANLWHQNLQEFSMDSNLINTIYSHQSLRKGKVSVAEMAFGMQLRDAGVKRYPLRARPRLLHYAVTLFYQSPDEAYIASLLRKLRDQYPLYQEAGYAHAREAALVYYPGQFNYHELVPLTITFVGLFLYVYFSVRKIEFIKSKLGLAACAVLTIAGSLSMTMGICFYFGFSLSLQGKEIFPYLVIIVGLENVLVLTKSVTTTDSRLDVKIRLAQGLSKEGWSITKNLLTEITILTVSFFTFVPFIQEFSIFMIVSLLSDYFIQMVFFATILGVDVRRMECFQERDSRLHLKEYFKTNSALTWSRSQPRLNGLHAPHSAHGSPADVVAERSGSPKRPEARVPKRVRLVNLWARTRFFQRAFMLWMLVWISMIVYNSGVVEYFVGGEEPRRVQRAPARRAGGAGAGAAAGGAAAGGARTERPVFLPLEVDAPGNDTAQLQHSPHHRPWTRLSPYHWSSILSHYNESVSGRVVVVLPPALLSQRVPPELAGSARHPDERDPPPLRWQALAAALDPIDLITDFELEGKPAPPWGAAAELPIYPTTPMEILLLAILCTISVAVIAYMMVVLYRCVCSRNYAEWRASWSEKEEYLKIIAKQPAVQLVMEAVPIVVSGHSHEVECLVTDGEKVVSSCLRGSIKVWDAQTGEQLTKIDRAAYFKLRRELCPKTKKSAHDADSRATVPPDVTPKNDESAPRLRRGLSSHLNSLRFRSGARADPPVSALEATKYDFAKAYTELYCSEQRDEPWEAKENIDISNQMSPALAPPSPPTPPAPPAPPAPREDVFIFSSKDKPRDRKQKGSDSDTLTSDSEDGWRGQLTTDSPVWCMDLCNDLIILGCADGRIEFWEATTGKLMCTYRSPEGGSARGVTHVRATCGARRVACATLGGRLVLLRIDAYNASAGVRLDWRFTTAHRRTHKRTGSAGSLRAASGAGAARMSFSYDAEHSSDNEEVQCVRVAACRPHQQPVSEMLCEGGRILTGSQDHTLKVFSGEDLSQLLTLHGHCGPVTAAFVDRASPHIAGSGSQDGLLAVWDLHTGACLYSLQAHDGAVTSLACTASYVVSAGADERLCVWDRFQGHMLNSLHIGLNYMSRMLPLTHSLLLAGDRGGLAVYDLSSGDVIRRVLLGQSDACIFVRQILPLKDAIVCDYANQLRIVRFPLVSKLADVKNE